MKMIYDYLTLARPKQWLKNILVFAGLIFAKKIGDPHSILLSVAGFAAFCVVSSALYFINDIIDREKDALHPVKAKRPLAAGKLKPAPVSAVALFLLIIAGFTAYTINLQFFYILFFYFIMTILYSLILKNIVILDVIIIAVGFVIRAVAGTYILEVEMSQWLLLCSFMLAMLIALGKRRNELISLGDNANNHRRNLKEYSIQMLDYFIIIIAGCSIMSYSLYCISERTEKFFHTVNLKYTNPIVVFGILRYIYVLFLKNIGGEPETLLYKDWGLAVAVLIWCVAVLAIIYFNFNI